MALTLAQAISPPACPLKMPSLTLTRREGDPEISLGMPVFSFAPKRVCLMVENLSMLARRYQSVYSGGEPPFCKQKGYGIDRTPPIRNQEDGGKRKNLLGEGGAMGGLWLGNAEFWLKGQMGSR